MTDSRHALVAAAVVVLVTVATWTAALGNDFVNYDDLDYVFDPRTLDGLSLGHARRAFTETLAYNYHPLTWLSHMLDVELFGRDPRGHHVGNVVLHAINGVLLFALLHRLSSSVMLATLLASFFVVHPLRVESVAWIAERKDVLCACFYLLTVVEWTGRRRLPLVIASAAAALLSKPMAVSLPAVLVAWDLVVDQRRLVDSLRRTAPIFALALGIGLVTFAAQGHDVKGTALVSATVRVQTFFVMHAETYLGNTIAPGCLYTPYAFPDEWPVWRVVAAVIVVVGIVALAVRCRHERPLVTFGVTWYALTMAPTPGLILVGIAAGADRYTYLPTVGLLIAVVGALQRRTVSTTMRRIAMVAGLVVIGLLAWSTQSQIGVWCNTATLFLHAAECGPDNPHALEMAAGIDLRHGDLVAARAKLVRATTLRPGLTGAWNLLGFVGLAGDDWRLAHDAFIETLSYDRSSDIAHLGLSAALLGLGNADASASELALADPSRAQAWYLRLVADAFERRGGLVQAGRLRTAAETSRP